MNTVFFVGVDLLFRSTRCVKGLSVNTVFFVGVDLLFRSTRCVKGPIEKADRPLLFCDLPLNLEIDHRFLFVQRQCLALDLFQ